ncbi:MAG TPA: WD40 repeat domain-containing protein [Gemmatales bacterium]|nr:WD40 repeat domain-containing protein [Gemmatales bacterium]
MRVPADVPPGKVQVSIDFSSWPALAKPFATGEVAIRRLPVVPVEEAVSNRLVRSLQHPDRNSSFSSLQFSKDGKRLWAGGYPEGNVVVYDVATGSRQTQIETGKSGRGSSNYANMTPDERSMLVIKERYGKIEHFDKDQQPMVRYLPVQGSVRRWNIETGELLWADSRPDQGRVVTLVHSPTDQVFVIEEEPPGEFPRGTHPKRRAFYGETSTGKLHPLPAGLSGFGKFSPDGKYFVTCEKTQDDSFKSIKLLDGVRFQEQGSWPIQETFNECYPQELMSNRQLIYLQYIYPRKGDWKNVTSRLMLLDLSQSNSQPRVLIPDTKESYFWMLSHEKSELLFLQRHGFQYELNRIDLSKPTKVRSTPLPSEPNRLYGVRSALSHSGKYLALAQRAEIPKELQNEDEIKPEQIGQPRIILIEVETGKVVDTLVSPHAFLAGFAFSPDDKTLATSGNGCIHLWDISHLK